MGHRVAPRKPDQRKGNLGMAPSIIGSPQQPPQRRVSPKPPLVVAGWSLGTAWPWADAGRGEDGLSKLVALH